MDCDIFLVGLNHRTAGVDVRERFALANHCDEEHWALPCTGAVSESIILSTCNRVEILAAGTGEVAEQVLRNWAGARKSDVEDLRPYVYVHKNLEAVRHLFSVASSLDSMVLGEPQILGQLKTAYRKAVKSRATGVILNRLLHKAFSVAKRVRTETAVASSAVSISYAAVELAKRIFGDMRAHKAMLVGAGEMAELAAMHLLQAGIADILVANRTLVRGQELAKQFNGHAIPFEDMPRHLLDVDIIITSTGSQEPIIRARDIRAALKIRKNRPMFFIDIAVPRDIDPDVNGLDNVYLYDIDDLKEVVEENLATRRDEAAKAAEIVNEEVVQFSRWLASLDMQPTIVDLIKKGQRAAEEELAKTLKRLGPVDDNTREALEAMAGALVRKLNHDPIMFLKHGGMSQEGNGPRISIMRRIFNLDKTGCIYSEEN
ncbi:MULTISPECIES: glutamyl-tRNA reductase [Desulfovibrio]|uniref:Glutamyl-tRNA reductase n=3 Tax=Desulfovibrio TaxID=872 RepID=HEM1_DESDA|nr:MULTISPECIES: glutamyl-tRNA reductase [Desulfovibrio]B8IZD9.1 RecName: Full=Glutamyl-tRNA reductase; Short=GluTR [Desulfovibrio desulfuricans ATCC 27774]ATD80973.1 glutamyl-tRNA reductase [Desulfovibrio sp. G11]MDY0204362.1 glutamyl-tRNA reductase [Desulfovibrio desulfuricans]SFW57782.1 glutamyl-tRNA reductase [Desulfovibrio desulfuricans]SPD36542.1 glutamyl-tRNA reductase [Desulfovibrio sp. G11]